MVRAGVFVGVDHSGPLEPLQDAAAGASRMYEWALSQHMGDMAELITDAKGKVTPGIIFDAIQDKLARCPSSALEHLVLYFAGHGVNINRCEQWLLSDAPVSSNAAVNVKGSAELAAYCGIGGITIISDACRVAPEGIQAQWVRGMDVFPNNAASTRARPVDQFFACELGATAAEVRDPVGAAKEYEAIYTRVFLEALQGHRPDLLDGPTDGWLFLRPAALIDYLADEVPRRLKERGLHYRINQQPESLVMVHKGWLSRFGADSVASADRVATSITGIESLFRTTGAPGAEEAMKEACVPPAFTPELLVRLGVTQNADEVLKTFQGLASEAHGPCADFAGSAVDLATPFGSSHFETQCGIKIRGARIVEFQVKQARGELLPPDDVLRIYPFQRPGACVALRFEGNTGTVVPVLPGFITALTLDRNELVDVALEPSENAPRWQDYANHAEDIRALRGLAAAASRHGRFRLRVGDAPGIAKKMQYARIFDPALSVYAAHAYHELQELDRIGEMDDHQRNELQVSFFDLEMLARRLLGRRIVPELGVVPFIPMLSQGWALLRAHGIALPPQLEGIERRMRDSVWSLFDGEGVDQLARALMEGDW